MPMAAGKSTTYPNHPKVELNLLVTHPDHASDQKWGDIQRVDAITTPMLLSGTAALKLKDGIIVRGRVVDNAGKPVEGAIVVRGDVPTSPARQANS